MRVQVLFLEKDDANKKDTDNLVWFVDKVISKTTVDRETEDVIEWKGDDDVKKKT